MAQQLCDKRDLDFVLWEQFETQELLETEKYAEYDKKTCEMVVNEARKLAIKELLPTLMEGDREGVKYEDGGVKVPECFHPVFKLLLEGEWGNLEISPEMGGQGVPAMVAGAAQEYLLAGNWPLYSYIKLATMAASIIQEYGDDEQRKTYVPKMVSGEWGGTMLLTEPNAGSDVGALETTAKKNPDGTYSLSGNKIFITGGDTDLFDNIIHPVLARIEGAPAGTKGISIFIAPKFLVNDDGSLGKRNGIYCTGVEHKMGIKASATCSMSMGAKDECVAYLLGEENQGMKIMFDMMNEARMGTGLQALCYASFAYMEAVNYARERIQMRELLKPDTEPAVPIIKHPDVRRNLLWMKSYVDGIRSFYYYMIMRHEKSLVAKDEKERKTSGYIFDLLTPVFKSYGANRGYEVCSQAVQVFGGAGYTQDYPAEQLLRDCKITSIFEGTCGIQAMDLLGRKLGMKKGKVFMGFMGEVQKTTAQAREIDSLKGLADTVDKMINKLGEVAMHLGGSAMDPEKLKTAFAHSLPFLDSCGDTVMAWMLLWRATTAASKLSAKTKKKDVAFYNGQIKTAEFFIDTLVPASMGKMDSILRLSSAAIDIEDEGFGGL